MENKAYETINRDMKENSGSGAKPRFWMVVRKMATEQRKTLLMVTGVLLGCCLGLGLWSGYLGVSPGIGTDTNYTLLAGLACAFVASKAGFDLIRKEGRISMLMTPARMSDKFLPRYIAVLPGMMLLAIVGYIVLVSSQILGFGLTYGRYPDFHNPLAGLNSYLTLSLFLTFSIFLLNESLFIFGAVAWPRLSFLKTTGIMVLITMFLPIVSIGFDDWSLVRNMDESDAKTALWIVGGIFIAIAAALSFCAYMRFKKITVIK